MPKAGSTRTKKQAEPKASDMAAQFAEEAARATQEAVQAHTQLAHEAIEAAMKTLEDTLLRQSVAAEEAVSVAQAGSTEQGLGGGPGNGDEAMLGFASVTEAIQKTQELIHGQEQKQHQLVEHTQKAMNQAISATMNAVGQAPEPSKAP